MLISQFKKLLEMLGKMKVSSVKGRKMFLKMTGTIKIETDDIMKEVS